MSEGTRPQHLEGNHDFVRHAAELAGSAIARIDIFSARLAADLWAPHDVIQAIKKVAIGHSRSEVRILICDASGVVSEGSRLVDLSRQLSSSIAIRQVSPMHEDQDAEWLLCDDQMALIRDPAERTDALRYDNDRVEVHTKRERFNMMWDASTIPPGLRELHI